MNKAFTKESDGHDDDDLPQTAGIPAGSKNYITPAGYARLRAELMSLIDVERPQVVDIVHWAASNGDRSENGDYIYGKKRLREIDRRIRFLSKRLDIAEVAEHIKAGKLPTQLAMTWASRVSFVLTENLALKKIKLLDVVMESAGRKAEGGEKDFDSDVAIATGELGQLIPQLIDALGGRQAAPTTAPAATPEKSAEAGDTPPW